MADTQRTLADLLTNLFQDGQPDNSITEQDMRDLIVSMASSYGGMIMHAPAATTIGTAGVFVKAAGTTAIGGHIKDFTMPLNNRLQYNGTAARTFLVTANTTISVAGNNKVIAITSAVNGIAAAPTVRAKINSSTDLQVLSGSRIIQLSPGDYIELFVTNETDTTSPTVTNMAYYISSVFG